jgi:glycosyltransferase 2 family protein
MSQTHPIRRILIWSLRLLILAAVIYGVGHTFQHAAARLDAHDWEAQPAWLAVAGAFYVAGLSAMAWYWHRLLTAYGQPVPLYPVFVAYFLGHLGKYSPGKALVLVLRAGALKRWLQSTWLGLWTVLLETLKLMAVGTVIGAILSVQTLSLPARPAAFAVALACAVFIGTLPPTVRYFGRLSLGRLESRLRRKANDETIETEPDKLFTPITWQLWFWGWIASSCCWLMFGLSLWAVLQAIGYDAHPIAELPLVVSTVTIAVVAGFLSFLPGGLVVRDALVLELLAPHCGESHALVAAVLLRVVWLVSEVLVCGILYVGVLRSRLR